MQIIFHVDLNAFFASAEISAHPQLQGKPVVISGASKRSIVTAASYEARKYGIHSAMPLFKALQLHKDIIVRPSNFTLYRHLSNEFFTIIAGYSAKLEVASIDECYVDVTSVIEEEKIHPIELAKKMQKHIYEALDLQCSIGISPNKFLAKMASDMKKPMGITMLTKSNIKEKMWPLDIKDMFGIGKRTQPRLKELGIETIGDVANYANYEKLRQVYAKHALVLYRKANGIDNSKINSSKNQLKSVGNSTTLDRDTTDEEELHETLKKLARQVSSRAIKRDLISNSVSITIKFTRFTSITRQTIVPKYINDYETILSTAKMLFDAHYDGKPVRLLGISLHNTIEKKNYKEQLSLFDVHQAVINEDKNNETDKVIDQINHSLKGIEVVKASTLVKQDEIQKKYMEEE